MANIIISRTANLDRPGNTEFLSGTLFADENLAHTFAISATRNGAEVALSGVVTACFIRPDGGTVELNGTIEDGKACVTLAESCYVVTGRFKLTVFVSVDGAKTAVYCAAGNVVETTTNTIIDPGSVVPSVDDIIAEYGTMQQAVEDCNTAKNNANSAAATAITAAINVAGAIADPYNAMSAYPVGSYCTRSSKLYRCITAIPTGGEAWTESHWTGVQAMEEVGDLKSAISGTGTSSEMVIADGINLAENAASYSSGSSYTTWYLPVEKGERIILTFQSTSANGFEARVGLSVSIPAAGESVTYLGKLTVPSQSTKTFECVADKDGYVGASWWKDNSRSASAVVYAGGIDQTINVLNADSAEHAAEIADLDNFRGYVTGETESSTTTLIDGLNLAENGVKYVSASSYATTYIQIVSGDEYTINFNNQNANSWYVRFGYASSIPANNVPATYVESKTIAHNTTDTYTYVAPADGYLSVSYYKMTNTSLDATVTANGLEQRINKDSNRITALEGLGDSIDAINDELTAMKGQEVQLESGSYWGATTVGTSVESGIQTSTSSVSKRTTLTLPANKVLRIMGVGISDSTRLYWVFSASTGILIDIVDATDQLAPRGYYLRYNEDTHIYINCANAYDHFIGIVDDVSPWVDISRCIGQTTRKIIDFDERDIRYAVRSMKRKSRNGSSYAPAMFLHFSDIHGDAENLTRLMEFAIDKHISNYLSDILCTGDVVKSTIDDGMTWFDAISGTNKILLLPGNHDSVKGTASSPTSASKQEMYETLFEGRVSNWNVTQPSDAATAYKGYYYKDYSAAKLRLICLDANGSGDYQTIEVAWLADALEGARGLGYSVVCAEHFMFDRSVCTGVKCTFQSDEEPENEGTWTIPAAYVDAVETFIDNGGDFVCWLGGHVHKDRLWIHNNTHQLCIGVTTASHETHQISYEDSERIAGDKSQDAFNIIGFDTFAKRITILKIGSDLTRVLAHKRYLCIDYANRTVLFND